MFLKDTHFPFFSDPSTGTRYLGLCVSGQTVGDLRFRLRNKLYPISEKLVLLIGTNDMLKVFKLITPYFCVVCIMCLLYSTHFTTHTILFKAEIIS